MNTTELVEWQKYAPNGLVYPWWSHPFLAELETWDLVDKVWLELGAGRSTAWIRSKCKWVDSIEADEEWAAQAERDCYFNGMGNGRIFSKTLPDGVQDRKQEFFDLFPGDVVYDIVSVDGIWRFESLQWALNHFKGRGGIIIADNWQQDFVWISPRAEELMKPYEIHRYVQPDHINHEGRPWNTAFWNIPA